MTAELGNLNWRAVFVVLSCSGRKSNGLDYMHSILLRYMICILFSQRSHRNFVIKQEKKNKEIRYG